MKVERIFDLLERYKQLYNKEDALAGKKNNVWIKYSSTNYIENSNLISYALITKGLKKGDKVAVITNNRPEWNFIDMGTLQAGVITTPIYPTISKDEYHYILDHSKPKFLFIANKNIYDKVKPIAQKVSSIEEIFTFDDIDGAKNWKELLDIGKKNAIENKPTLESIKSEISPEDLATIIYTSGTTGYPKGVMLTHSNLVSNFTETTKVHHLSNKHRALSFLPLCHVYERMMNYHYQYKGISIYYAESMGAISENLKEIKPHIFVTVPRLLETVYDKIINVGNELPFIKRKIFFWSVNLGLKFKMYKKNGWWYHFRLKIADKLVFHKWRESLGGEVELIVSGGAALQTRLERIFWAAGLEVYEGYGLTETSPVIAVNNPIKKEVRFGTVGPVINGVKVKISEDGEILCKGPNIMKGYYKAPDLTKEVINDDGWFHTGDAGEFIDGKYLKITDRKKEIFKLSSGKYIAPQVIENKFKESIFIEQIMVIGENQKFASALISPNFEYLHNWAYHQKISFRDNEELIDNPKVIELYQKEVNQLNKELGQTEQIKRFRIVHEEWSANTGELSPTLKLKRDVITNKYIEIINQIFSIRKKENHPNVISKISSNIKKNIKKGVDTIRKPF